MQTGTHFLLCPFDYWEVEHLSLPLIIVFHLNILRISLYEDKCPAMSLFHLLYLLLQMTPLGARRRRRRN